MANEHIKKVSRFGIQRKIVANMTSESWRNIPHVSYIYEPDVTEFIKAYKEFDASLPEGKHVTLNTVVLKAITEAIKVAPQMNAHIHFEKKLVRGKITQYDNIDVSMPWILPDDTMMTINMKDMGNRSLGNMTEYMHETAEKLKKTNLTEAMYSVSMNDTVEALRHGKVVRVMQRLIGSKTNKKHRVTPLSGEAKKRYDAIPDNEKITKDDLKQGTITISNIGSITRGIDGAVALLMIIPPQICAIGISALQKRPVVETDENGKDVIKVANILPINVVFDHRALDFGEIKPFLAKLDEIFQNPEQILVY
ncbi:MAG: 2-oxo acid dehydrogenase subunit E2 [Clostridia bacterium]|nr:2-oxo acid dehydrogenase subunit E2 [Clostridia bacterium]